MGSKYEKIDSEDNNFMRRFPVALLASITALVGETANKVSVESKPEGIPQAMHHLEIRLLRALLGTRRVLIRDCLVFGQRFSFLSHSDIESSIIDLSSRDNNWILHQLQ